MNLATVLLTRNSTRIVQSSTPTITVYNKYTGAFSFFPGRDDGLFPPAMGEMVVDYIVRHRYVLTVRF